MNILTLHKPFKNKIFLALFILFISALTYLNGYFFDKGILYWDQKADNLGFSIKSLEESIATQDAEMKMILDSVVNQLNHSYRYSPSKFDSLFKWNYLEQLHNTEMSVYVYSGDSMVYWSNSRIPLDPFYQENKLQTRLVNLTDGYYLVNRRHTDNEVVVGLTLIKKSYSYQNKFLVNQFADAFELKPSFNIETDEGALGFVVKDIDDSFLMKIMPSYTALSDKPFYFTSISFYVVAMFGFLVGLFVLFAHLNAKRPSFWWIVFLFVVVSILRYITVEYKVPANLYSLKIFKPQYFGESFLFSSLGDFILNGIVLLFLGIFFFRHFPVQRFRIISTKHKVVFLITLHILSGMLFFWIQHLIQSLILNSSITFEVYKVLELNSLSLIGFAIIILLLFTFMAVLHRLTSILRLNYSLSIAITINLLAVIIVMILSLVFKTGFSLYGMLFLLLLIGVELMMHYRFQRFKYYSMVILIFVLSGFTLHIISTTVQAKEREARKVLVVNVAAERDPIAELLLIQVEDKILNDTNVHRLVREPLVMRDELRRYINNRYLTGYLAKYDMQLTVCAPEDSLWIENEERNSLCYGFFYEMVAQTGVQLGSSNFYFLDNLNSRISYFGWLKHLDNQTNSELTIFLELDSKLVNEKIGYPELLLENKLEKKSQLKDYSYGKYKDNVLVNQSGTYNYPAYYNFAELNNDEMAYQTIDDYIHLVYRIDESSTIVLSKPEIRVLDLLTSFSYIFVVFYILLSILLLFNNIITRQFTFNLDYRNRIQISMISVLTLSLLIIGGGTVYFNIKQYRTKHKSNLQEKIQSVYVEFEHKLLYEKSLTKDWKSEYYTNLDELLMKFANVFYLDINLYATDGSLLATSRPEIFERGLKSLKINPQAFKSLKLDNNQIFVNSEHIGKLNYQSGYIPFRNIDKEVLGYINLPYFAKQSELRQEISTFLVAIINIYVLLILVAIVLAVFITNQITQPLRLIEDSFRRIKLGEQNRLIEYQGQNEIGSLVAEYNRMVIELEKSAELLAKSERESAWREMAKQIAHEIKNPLTPMKLSIQYLLRSWSNKDEEFPDRLKSVSDILIQQINDLSNIATQFSNFAKIPRSPSEIVNLCKVINKVVQLFENSEEAEIKFECDSKMLWHVFVDVKQMERVFINLIKNGLQAIPEERRGQIEVSLVRESDKALIGIADNGVGIPEELRDKLFRPNFTTKSSGMGLGLAIVKNIIESEKGSIWFETEVDKGTTFYIALPLVGHDEF